LPKVSKEGWDLSPRVNPTGELREPLPIWEANRALGQIDLVFVEALNGPAGMGTYPPEAELVIAARTFLR
jgi:hypothetical protein